MSATSAVLKPNPNSGKTNARIASDGTARPTLPTLIAMNAPSGERLTSAVKRVALLSNERSRAVKFEIDKGKVEVTSSIALASGTAPERLIET